MSAGRPSKPRCRFLARDRRPSGFTLLEMLLVIAVLGIMTTVVVQLVRTLRKGQDVLARHHSMISAGRSLVRTLSGDLSALTWVGPGSFEAPDAETAKGRGPLLRVTIAKPRDPAISTSLERLARVEYRFETVRGRPRARRLVRVETALPLLSDSGSARVATAQSVLEGLHREVRVRCLHGETWTDGWPPNDSKTQHSVGTSSLTSFSSPVLPDLIEVRAVMERPRGEPLTVITAFDVPLARPEAERP